jgi:hypothetical protein
MQGRAAVAFSLVFLLITLSSSRIGAAHTVVTLPCAHIVCPENQVCVADKGYGACLPVRFCKCAADAKRVCCSLNGAFFLAQSACDCNCKYGTVVKYGRCKRRMDNTADVM